MKSLIIALFLVVATLTVKAQAPKDTLKTYTIKLEVKENDEGLLYFVLQNAPLMKTKTPADELEGLYAKLNAWFQAAKAQIDKKKPPVVEKK